MVSEAAWPSRIHPAYFNERRVTQAFRNGMPDSFAMAADSLGVLRLGPAAFLTMTSVFAAL
jgi:hypothetical protein